ncbi:hypothetical protein Xen7305DRAFT_00032180 [Xenococcus sp. PCC 7305]|uniref:hypothetical protein n=1 Tax=Xenococcus sp. PCC 7305 TaxID=102125 RepID=UPI0002AC8CA1|nr:hypothetical protein [Xenococcus sp. PCC 7305]ELS03494.1 hypothetical protein Xen7305DRAFT_00032180 [Xenococcus sp. PCC 7305]
MYLKIGNTKLFAGKYQSKELAKIEINFEYIFSGGKSNLPEGEAMRSRRFANVLVDLESKKLKIKIKSEFSNTADCGTLSRLLIGIEKIITPENIEIIDQIIDGKSAITTQDFLKSQEQLLEYFL